LTSRASRNADGSRNATDRPKVWNDPKRAQDSQERSARRTVTRLATIASSLRDSRGLFEMAAPENDDATLAGIARRRQAGKKSASSSSAHVLRSVDPKTASWTSSPAQAAPSSGWARCSSACTQVLRPHGLPHGVLEECRASRRHQSASLKISAATPTGTATETACTAGAQVSVRFERAPPHFFRERFVYPSGRNIRWK